MQTVLIPKGFSDFASEREICLSLAASIRDVCRKDADRGVDLILSVSVGFLETIIYLFFCYTSVPDGFSIFSQSTGMY